MITNMRIQLSFFSLLSLLMFTIYVDTAFALSTDRDQPAVIEADEVELDFNTGERIYKGNVIVEQGTLLIKGDKMIVKYKDEQLETATAWGNPATFKQRPDGKDQDVLGKGRKIILNDIKNTLTLLNSASLKQGSDWANGEIIVYNMGTDKMTIKSSAPGTKKTKKGETPAKKKRARVVIMPSKKSALSPRKPKAKEDDKKSAQ